MSQEKQEEHSSEKPLKEVPGSYGIPWFGAIKDRLDYYWFQGNVDFFKKRMEKYKSTVFRVNFSPGPPGYPDPRGVAVLDQKSFSVLMDNTKVDKTDTLLGPYRPDLAFNGGYRVLPYLDTTEEKHTQYKSLIFDILKLNSHKFVPEFSKSFKEISEQWDATLAKSGVSETSESSDNLIINFLLRSITHRDPSQPGPASLPNAHSTYLRWIGVQFAALAIGTPLPHIIEELLLHTFRLPFFLCKTQYQQICDFFRTYATEALDMAEQRGLNREETVHHLVLSFGLNARLGLQKMIAPILFYIARAGPEFQSKLSTEVHSVIQEEGGAVTNEALVKMPLVKATVLECLRLMPSILFQFGRARSDIVVESHDAKFKIKKGELIGNHQYFVMRDPKVFSDPDSFDPNRFMGEKGQALLHHLVWSNGRETESPSPTNKQCPGKNLAELILTQFIAEMFLKYESFDVTPKSVVTTTTIDVSIKSLVTKHS